ncbi:MAG: hypothetical protein SGPRY_006452, partial [Prymnesium sp.]
MSGGERSEALLLLLAAGTSDPPPPSSPSYNPSHDALCCEERLERLEGEGDLTPAGRMRFTMGPIFTALRHPVHLQPPRKPSVPALTQTPSPKSKPAAGARPEGVSALLQAAGKLTFSLSRPSSPEGGRGDVDMELESEVETGAESDQHQQSPPAPRILNKFFARERLPLPPSKTAKLDNEMEYLNKLPSYGSHSAANGSRTSSRAASRAKELPPYAPLDEGSRSRYFCRYPGCKKVYATTDGVRKHCRQQHKQWLKRLGPGCPDLYCRKDLEATELGESETPPDESGYAPFRPKGDGETPVRAGARRQLSLEQQEGDT